MADPRRGSMEYMEQYVIKVTGYSVFTIKTYNLFSAVLIDSFNNKLTRDVKERF